MKLTKMDCQLNEKDTLQDMLESETVALFEGSTKAVRKNFSTNLLGVAEDQFCLFTQMQTRGYYEPAPAKKAMIDEANDTYKKQKNSLKAK